MYAIRSYYGAVLPQADEDAGQGAEAVLHRPRQRRGAAGRRRERLQRQGHDVGVAEPGGAEAAKDQRRLEREAAEAGQQRGGEQGRGQGAEGEGDAQDAAGGIT